MRVKKALVMRGWQRAAKGPGKLYDDDLNAMWNGQKTKENGHLGLQECLNSGIEEVAHFIVDEMTLTPFGEIADVSEFNGKTKDKVLFYPMAILYMNKSIGIGYPTFVHQMFRGKYSVFVADFYPVTIPTTLAKKEAFRSTKKDVHFSEVNSLIKLIYHDFQHRKRTLNFLRSLDEEFQTFFQKKNTLAFSEKTLTLEQFLESLKEKPDYDLIEFLKPFYGTIKTFLNYEIMILFGGLFFITHELDSVDDSYQKNNDFFTTQNADFGFFKAIISSIKNQQVNRIFDRSTDYYKMQFRDDEYILTHATDLQGNPYLPLINVNGHKKLLPVAKHRDGRIMIILKADKNIAHAFVVGSDVTQEFPYIVDDNGTMILPPDWKFMSKAEREREAYFYSAPRQTYAAMLIKEGFTKFWHDFEILVDKAFNRDVSSSLGSN